MSDTLFLGIVLVTFGLFMGGLAWVSITTPPKDLLEDPHQSDKRPSGE
jgi:hypothetical protein